MAAITNLRRSMMTAVQLIFIVSGMRGLAKWCSSSSAKVQKKIGRAQEGRRMGGVRVLEWMAMK